MTTFESRLDRIESLLERHIIQAERDRQTLVETVNTISNRLDQIAINAERDRLNFQNNFVDINQRSEAEREAFILGFQEITRRAEIDRNTFLDSISENSEDIERLNERFDQFIEQAAADRQQAVIDRQQFQAEIRRIWEYLYLLQGRNGSTPH
jgi:hypothetical protein